MKNYNKFLAVKIIVFAMLSFTASAHTVKAETSSTQIEQSLDSCIDKKSKEIKTNNSVKFQSQSTSVPTLFELANMLEVNLGGEQQEDQSPEVKERLNSPVMSLREMITLYGVKVL